MVLGTRETDPHAQNWGIIMPSDTDQGWPEFTRLMPLYYWSYSLIWKFILECELPYCPLYDKGFTYLGDQSNSVINPFLKENNLPSCFGNDNIGRSYNYRTIFQSIGF